MPFFSFKIFRGMLFGPDDLWEYSGDMTKRYFIFVSRSSEEYVFVFVLDR